TLGGKDRYDRQLNEGRHKIFEVRRVYNDVNFIEEFLTDELIDRLKLYQYRRDPHTGQYRIVSRDHKRIRETMLYQLTNLGLPFIYICDANYRNAGELYLAHRYNGVDLDLRWAAETLKNLQALWGRPVHLQTRIEDETVLLTNDGKQSSQQRLNGDAPKPAHRMT
ncbi:MAG: SpoVR family protein, partial [Phycisphaerae bacterium]